MLSILALLASSAGLSAQPAFEGDEEMFRGASCAEAGSRAGEVRSGKLAGVPLHQAVRDMNGTALDAAIIVSVYDISSGIASHNGAQTPEAFQADWVSRCNLAASDVPVADAGPAQQLFADMSCAAVQDRAGVIMIGRMGGLSWSESRTHLRKSELDDALINDAYSLPRSADTSEGFQQQEDFQNAWEQRCELMRL